MASEQAVDEERELRSETAGNDEGANEARQSAEEDEQADEETDPSDGCQRALLPRYLRGSES